MACLNMTLDVEWDVKHKLCQHSFSPFYVIGLPGVSLLNHLRKSNDCDFGSITVLLSRLQTASMGIRHGRLDRSDKLPGVCTPPTNL